VTFVKMGNFENAPAPVFEAYVKDRHGFEKAWEGIGQFEVNPPSAGWSEKGENDTRDGSKARHDVFIHIILSPSKKRSSPLLGLLLAL
jgi:hypothetical protein